MGCSAQGHPWSWEVQVLDSGPSTSGSLLWNLSLFLWASVSSYVGRGVELSSISGSLCCYRKLPLFCRRFHLTYVEKLKEQNKVTDHKLKIIRSELSIQPIMERTIFLEWSVRMSVNCGKDDTGAERWVTEGMVFYLCMGISSVFLKCGFQIPEAKRGDLHGAWQVAMQHLNSAFSLEPAQHLFLPPSTPSQAADADIWTGMFSSVPSV